MKLCWEAIAGRSGVMCEGSPYSEAGKIEIGAEARVAVTTGVPMKKKIRKQEKKNKNKRTYHRPD